MFSGSYLVRSVGDSIRIGTKLALVLTSQKTKKRWLNVKSVFERRTSVNASILPNARKKMIRVFIWRFGLHAFGMTPTYSLSKLCPHPHRFPYASPTYEHPAQKPIGQVWEQNVGISISRGTYQKYRHFKYYSKCTWKYVGTECLVWHRYMPIVIDFPTLMVLGTRQMGFEMDVTRWV